MYPVYPEDGNVFAVEIHTLYVALAPAVLQITIVLAMAAVTLQV
jgi:hypothetical protein